MALISPLNQQILNSLKSDVLKGNATAERHPSLPLTIYNTSPNCWLTNNWSSHLAGCTGLVLGDEGRIYGRRDFNVQNGHTYISNHLTHATEAIDGFPGLIFQYKGELVYCTDNSFVSIEAKILQSIFEEKYIGKFQIDQGRSYLFEVIDPSTKNIVDYGSVRDIIYVGSLSNDRANYLENYIGMEWLSEEIPPTPSSYSVKIDANTIPDKEGKGIYISYQYSHQKTLVYYKQYVRKLAELYKIDLNVIKAELFKHNGLISKYDAPETVLKQIVQAFNSYSEIEKTMITGLYSNYAKAGLTEADHLNKISKVEPRYHSLLLKLLMYKPVLDNEYYDLVVI